MSIKKIITLAALCVAASFVLRSQEPIPVNYDEEKVGPYTLEDPLVFVDGHKVGKKADWPARRKEILDIFQREMYGQLPPAPDTLVLETIDEGLSLAGHAKRRQVKMSFRADGSGPSFHWLILTPEYRKGPYPVIMLLNYEGNHTVIPDTEVVIPDITLGLVNDSPASVVPRGTLSNPSSASILPVNMLLARGYAVVTACYEEISPDPHPDKGREGQDREAYTRIFDLWGPRDPSRDDNTSSLMAWAWGLMRGMDLVCREPDLDASRVLLTGYSRLGKAAMLAGAYDERFAAVVLNQTGGGGAPLTKRCFGENVATEVASYSHWYSRSYDKYAGKEQSMPFDQHLLLACIAPRPLMVQGFDELWFDTRGEFLALKAASPVWKFLGYGGLPDVEWPGDYERSAIGPRLAYYHRPLGHGIAAIDWEWMLGFAGPYLR